MQKHAFFVHVDKHIYDELGLAAFATATRSLISRAAWFMEECESNTDFHVQLEPWRERTYADKFGYEYLEDMRDANKICDYERKLRISVMEVRGARLFCDYDTDNDSR